MQRILIFFTARGKSAFRVRLMGRWDWSKTSHGSRGLVWNILGWILSGGMGREISTILLVLDTVYHRQSYGTNEGLCTMKYVLSIIITLAIIYIVPFVLYAASTVVWDLEPPEDVAPWQFLLGVLVTKIGTAIAFVLLYQFSKVGLRRKWSLYALIWWLSFAIAELGQAIGPHYTWKEAIIGIISEAIYFPLAAVLIDLLIGRK